jgi:hypothetical protein
VRVLLHHRREGKMSRIKTVEQMTPDVLTAMFNEDLLAIRIPHYIDASLCDELSNWFIEANQLECYYHDVTVNGSVDFIDYGVDRLGVSYNITFGKNKNSAEYQRYYANALSTIHEIRKACKGRLSPIDKFRLEIDENWAHGARIASFDENNMTLGIGRVMNRPEKSYMTEIQPHIDLLPPHISDIKAQYSANIYLSLPTVGGELELWDIPSIPTNEALAMQNDYDWRAKYPDSILITPKKGELIVINTRRPHAIRAFSSGKRVTQQCFIGLKQDRSIVLWS